ncbi:secretin and TonB N-terminal domain-containing protein [Hyalangium rubrum]|uniref:Secretin and TonB N-terminal domain-containing protein n=1 Tax=Hyalangium rubrum TaxID=3103134 RepID=A0ABU5HCP5_9BACT|nr:secretin and TonB N-terminal domain-containing protein [Hyalangium sp. s54d21]MDY7231230.1 secretin and TonB N-terminal domain-containing protein [Hyalangium sp. s54d21]
MSLVRAALAALVLVSLPALAQAPRPASKRVNIDVVRADIHDVLRMLAEVGRLNVVVADEVQGKVTLKLKDVPWRQALDTVLSSHGLGQELRGNVLRVAPLKQLAEEAASRAKLKQAHEELAPLNTYLIPLSYAKASDMLPHVQAQLSPRGKVSVDARTNTLIVTDVGPVTLP